MSVNEHKPEPAEKKFDVKGDINGTSTTIVLGDEDHTLGNSLRHVLMQIPSTDFCGYSVPHPSEPYVHIRLQTNDRPVLPVLRQGLTNLAEVCDALDEKVVEALAAHEDR